MEAITPAEDGRKELDYTLVEIVGKADNLDNVIGRLGQVVSWSEDEGKYLVETFDGDSVSIAQESLQEYDPPAPEAGGFHVAMPRSDYRAEYFPAELIESLEERLYCVVQATSSPADRKSATRAVLEREDKWTRILPELESLYMGQNPGGKKVLWLPHVDEPDDEFSSELGLSTADRALTVLSGYLGPVCPVLGFEAVHRTNAFVHSQCERQGEEEELLKGFEDPSFKVTAEEMKAHLSFKYRRKICMMYFVYGSGGTLTLYPSCRGWSTIEIPCTENQIIVFRHDICDYDYRPEGNQLCVQAWILREQQAGEVGISSADLTDRYNEDIDKIPDGPSYGTSAETVDCMSLASRFPCNTYAPEDYWSLLAVACDGAVRIPQTRWDHDLYFDADPHTSVPGKAYAQHFGMLEQEALANFANEFFDIEAEEAQCIDPPARVLTEIGYDCLYRGGWTRKKLLGKTFGMCFGAAEGEFSGMQMAGFFGINKRMRTGLMPAMTAARLYYIFGIKGPTTTCETACSSALSATCVMHHWMRPRMPEHIQTRPMSQQVEYGMAGGANAAFNANTMIGFCGAHMLSIQGRCFTFDQSGDGFMRAEGIGAMHYKVSRHEDHARLAMLAASQMNQDGRSASLTAPHGPSQQECIRLCLREARVTPLDVQVQELHGTGTALGDPIETGSLRATMMSFEGEVREHPLVKTSSKSNFGHTELNAGMCGIMKCCLLGLYCVASPNCHIRLLNPHIDSNAYPVLFSQEMVDQNKDTSYCGVSSFGWSGCNARGDLWSRCLAGPRNTEPSQRLLDLSHARLFRYAALNRLSAPPDPGGPVDAALEDLEAYRGEYGTSMPPEENTFYCTGSFSAWSRAERMEWWDDLQAYVCAFSLGEACIEQFQIVVNRSDYLAIFPAAKMADASALVLGPGMAPPGHVWALDGRRGRAEQGTVFAIFFTWDPATRKKRVWWEVSTDERALAMAARIHFCHSYSLVGTWTLWKPVKMMQARKDGAPDTFQAEVRVGLDRKEAFRILRDGDERQAIYPVQIKSGTGEELQVLGPDPRHGDKKWEFEGKNGEAVHITLRVWEGAITVTTASSRGATTWSSKTGPRSVYYISASWNGYSYSAMTPVDGRDGVFTTKLRLTRERLETFHIVVDQDLGQVIHPEMHMADQNFSQAMGPDAKGKDFYWAIFGTPGAELEIKLDLTQADLDRRKVVTWEIDNPDVVIRREGFDPSADAPTFPVYEYEEV